MKHTVESFTETVGYVPENDDLTRANCEMAGAPGHYYCGMCQHGIPKFLVCQTCRLYEASARTVLGCGTGSEKY